MSLIFGILGEVLTVILGIAGQATALARSVAKLVSRIKHQLVSSPGRPFSQGPGSGGLFHLFTSACL